VNPPVPPWADAVEAAFRAVRDDVREAFARRPGRVEMKEDRTVVTALDRRLETAIGERLLAIDPAFGLVGEEHGEMRPGDPTWYLDPLDGTLNFTRRISRFASQAVLLEGEEPVFAAVYEPLLDDYAWAARGAGAWREGRPMRVSDRPVGDAVLLLDVSKGGRFMDVPGLIRDLRRAVYRVRALGTIAVQMRDVADGAAEAFFGSRRSPSRLHDVGPGVLLVREAGGTVTDAEGRDPFAERRSLLAASPSVHAALRTLLT
jgi:myo-inositol-1(or 4)-monophosphatase